MFVKNQAVETNKIRIEYSQEPSSRIFQKWKSNFRINQENESDEILNSNIQKSQSTDTDKMKTNYMHDILSVAYDKKTFEYMYL